MSEPLLPLPTEIVVTPRRLVPGQAAGAFEYPLLARLLERGEIPLEDAFATYVRQDEVERRLREASRIPTADRLTLAERHQPEGALRERRRIAEEILGPSNAAREARSEAGDALTLYGQALLESVVGEEDLPASKKVAP